MKCNFFMTCLLSILFLRVSAGCIKKLNGSHVAAGQLVMTRQSALHRVQLRLLAVTWLQLSRF